MFDKMPYIWGAIIALAIILEAATNQLISIWFVFSGLLVFVLSLCDVPLTYQIIIFVVVSFLLLIITKPLAKKLMRFKKEDTNLGRVINKQAVVIHEIDNLKGVGQVSLGGNVWSAKSIDNSLCIAKNEIVIVKGIQGVKLIVEKI
jgi:membrane protein implicated in regulation of membrane protease activity